ncbi:MAG: hypothetical protein QNJ51_25805 [Calothrix sp. MO_167.B12]|nr:hypothetical protein [Calothrix sp. MO_167.B12]
MEILIQLLLNLVIIYYCIITLINIFKYVIDGFKSLFRRGRKTKYHRRSNSYLAKASNNNPGYAGAWHQLLKRVNFDVELAERLVSQCKRRNPRKSDRWCIEKAIHDLERDRGL